MREVEAEILVAHIGAFLLDMCPENLAQGLMQEVCRGVVVFDAYPSCRINMQAEAFSAV